MNIFVLDLDVKKCAEYHCDKHLVKMITEHNQILGSIAYSANGILLKKNIPENFIKENFKKFPRSNIDGTPHPYGIGFVNHPCTRWAAKSHLNYEWLCKLNLAMCEEYTKRYKRIHVGQSITQWYKSNKPKLNKIDMTEFVQAMPDECKNVDPVIAYRDYYNKYKARFAKWNHGPTPNWYNPHITEHTQT